MKTLYTALLLFFAGTSHALPIGNPIEANLFDSICCQDECEEPVPCRRFNVAVGFYGDYVFNRHLETVHHKNIDTTKIFTNAAYLSLFLWDRLEAFTALGISRLSLNTSLGAFNAVDPHPLFEIESETDFSYSVGGRVILAHYRCATLGLEGQYFSTRPHLKRLYIAAGAVSYPGDTLQTHYQEWQVGLGISYHYNDFFVPYIAVKHAESKWRLNNGKRFVIESNTGTFLYNLRARKHWGFAVGLTLCPLTCEKLAVTAEARFADEKALYINGQLQF